MTCKKTKDNGEGRYSSRSAGVADGLWMTMTIPVKMMKETIKKTTQVMRKIFNSNVEQNSSKIWIKIISAVLARLSEVCTVEKSCSSL